MLAEGARLSPATNSVTINFSLLSKYLRKLDILVCHPGCFIFRVAKLIFILSRNGDGRKWITSS